jgi:hypothetical protein
MQPIEVELRAPERSAAPDLYGKWGVLPGPWLWATHLRILFVLDGRIDTGRTSGCFGLGLVLDTLRDNSFAWWVRFEVDVVRRDDGIQRLCAPDSPDENPASFNFRFTNAGFDIDQYDQIWFFGDFPSNRPDDPNDAKYVPLSNAELKLLAEWMDRGGGVFATGDHANLGASMCSRIPRVRTMRKWTAAQGMPPQHGPDRHETTQGAPGTITTYAEEEDAVPQTIEPVYRPTATSIAIPTYVPHPLLCARGGVIDKFPDHMHEGEVIADDAVELDRPLGIPGYKGVEYPAAVDKKQPRPRPQVVAYGRTTPQWQHEDGPVNPKRFPLIGAYDGDPAGIGRVVVDSTWHHWFSVNLHGLRDLNPPVYEHMQAYYRNVALWLATPAQRDLMLFASAWGAVVSDPMAFPVALRRNLWQVGEKAVDVIGRTATQCTLWGLVVNRLDAKAVDSMSVPAKLPPANPHPGVPPELVIRAVVGGVATSLLEPALEYHEARGRKRRLLDPELIARRAGEGVKLGHRALLEAVRESAAAGEKLATVLAEGFRPVEPESISIPVELVQVRIVAERLQLPDPKDPALGDGQAMFTIRLRLGGTVVAHEVIEDVEVPSFGDRGAVIGLDRVLYEGVVQSGERLLLELAVGSAGADPASPDRVRFNATLGGDPSTWVGLHEPSAAHKWRLWYRVELGNGDSEAQDVST